MERIKSAIAAVLVVAAFWLATDRGVAAQLQSSGARTWSSIANAAGAVIASVLDLTNNDALAVAIVDGNGTQITSFGGGTQYAEDAALGATPTGTLSMARRDDTLSTLTPVEDDAVSLRTNNRGALWTTVDGSVAATQSGTWNINAISSALPAGTNTLGKAAPLTTCGTTAFSQPWVAVPTTSTAITATTTCDAVIVFTNTNSSAQTVTVTDGQGTPVTVVDTFSIPGKSTVRFELEGPMTTGIKWAAGGTGVTGAAKGVQ